MYADLADVSSGQEAAARIATSLGVASFPVAVDEILRLHCCLAARPAGALGQYSTPLQIHDWKMLRLGSVL